jgi:hypothetical protein
MTTYLMHPLYLILASNSPNLHVHMKVGMYIQRKFRHKYPFSQIMYANFHYIRKISKMYVYRYVCVYIYIYTHTKQTKHLRHLQNRSTQTLSILYIKIPCTRNQSFVNICIPHRRWTTEKRIIHVYYTNKPKLF